MRPLFPRPPRLLAVSSLLLALTPPLVAQTAEAPPHETRPIPDYLQQATGCAVLVSGSVGASFAQKEVSELWQRINTAIAEPLHRHLLADGHRVESLTIQVDEAPELVERLMLHTARSRCSRALQFATDAGEDANGRYFGFTVTMMRMVPGHRPATAAGTPTISQREYLKSYRFARTSEVFDRFSTSAFARQVFNDLQASGALKPLQP